MPQKQDYDIEIKGRPKDGLDIFNPIDPTTMLRISTATDDVNNSRQFITEKAKFLEGTVQGRRIRQWGQSRKPSTSSATKTNLHDSRESNANNIGRSNS